MWLRAGRSVCSTLNETALPVLETNFNKLLEKTIEYATQHQRAQAQNTKLLIRQILSQLNRITDIHDPKAVEKTILNAKNEKTKQPLSNTSKRKWQLVYELFCNAHNITGYNHTKFKIKEPIPIIPSKSQVERIISATPEQKYRTIFTLMTETGAEGEEIHRTTRSMIDLEQRIITITGVKGHESGNYKLKEKTAKMLEEYLAKHAEEYPFSNPKLMGQAWIRARDKLASDTKSPELKKIPMKNLRNYSGAQLYISMPVRDPIGVMRHLRHKKIERTMHYIRAIVLPTEEDMEWTHIITHTIEEEGKAIDTGYTLVRAINETTALYKKRKA